MQDRFPTAAVRPADSPADDEEREPFGGNTGQPTAGEILADGAAPQAFAKIWRRERDRRRSLRSPAVRVRVRGGVPGGSQAFTTTSGCLWPTTTTASTSRKAKPDRARGWPWRRSIDPVLAVRATGRLTSCRVWMSRPRPAPLDWGEKPRGSRLSSLGLWREERAGPPGERHADFLFAQFPQEQADVASEVASGGQSQSASLLRGHRPRSGPRG